MFQPSAADVRRFFCGVYAKQQQQAALEPIEALAAEWIKRHPEFHAALADLPAALAQLEAGSVGAANAGAGNAGAGTGAPLEANPYLHLSLHLSISEQCSIDQPAGIRQAVELLAARRGSVHEAQHEVMEDLGQMLWDSQHSGQPPDAAAYIDRVRRRATRD